MHGEKVYIVPKTDSKGDKRSVQVHDRDGPPRLPFIWHVWINLNMPINLLSCALCLCAHRDIIQL